MRRQNSYQPMNVCQFFDTADDITLAVSNQYNIIGTEPAVGILRTRDTTIAHQGTQPSDVERLDLCYNDVAFPFLETDLVP